MEFTGQANQDYQKTIYGLNQLDVAVLLEKYNMIFGMLHYGTPVEKEKAKEELKNLHQRIYNHVSPAAFHEAAQRLGLTEEELAEIGSVNL